MDARQQLYLAVFVGSKDSAPMKAWLALSEDERRARERRDRNAADRAVERPVEAADAVAHDRSVFRVGDNRPGLREEALLFLSVEVPADGTERVVLQS